MSGMVDLKSKPRDAMSIFQKPLESKQPKEVIKIAWKSRLDKE